MNHDEKKPDLQALIEPELEARLVAWVLGEASAFEAAEMERQIAEKPELAIFMRRIEAVNGLVGLAVRPEKEPLRLAPERRAKIRETIGATSGSRTTDIGTDAPVVPSLAATRRKQQRVRMWTLGIAACFTLGAILAFLATPAYRKMPMSFESAGADRDFQDRLSREKASARMPMQALERAEERRSREGAVVRMEMPRAALLAPPTAVGGAGGGVAAQNDANRNAKPGSEIVFNAPAPQSPPLARPAARGAVSGLASAGAISTASGAPAPGRVNLGAGTVGGIAGGTARRENSPSANQFGLAAGKLEQRPSQSLIDGKNFGFGSTASLGANGGVVLNAPMTGQSGGLGANANVRIAGEYFDGRQFRIKTDARDKKSGDEVIPFSPFTVASSKDAGLSAANTIAVAGIDSNFGAAPASTVAGVKQLAETSAIAIKEFALVETDTEGTRKAADLDGQNRAFSAAVVDDRLSKEKAAAKPESKKAPQPDSTRVEISAAKEPVSTFSLHVSDVSFRLAQAALTRGEKPDPERIRAEEFYNAFDYGDPAPTTAEKIACRIEQAAHPMLQQRNLVRIAMRVPATGRGAGQPLRLTVLLDTSGSMERDDRVASVRRALEVLASLLGPNDRVTLIGFAQRPRLLAEGLPGDQAAKLAAIAAHTPYTGGTNLEEALKLSGELARRHQDAAAQNRIVLITDGAANLGNADPAQLATAIEGLRRQGIAFDACGVGTDGLDDAILEALTRKGDGRYYVLDKPEDADAGFARQLAGAFRPAAENVKVQVRFNPARVGRYRLIGFEQHRLREEDFRNDQVDAAELAAEEAAVALYQVEVLPQGDGELGEVFVRFRDAATGHMVERSWTMLHDPQARAFDRSTPTLQLAGTAALLAEKLRGGEMADLVDLAELAPVVNALRGHFANAGRVQELATMFEQLRRMSGK